MRVYKCTKPLERFYILNKQVLAKVDMAKYLGVMIKKKLDCSPYINSIVKSQKE